MAIFNKGILGGFSGKVGPVTGSNWKKLYILKSRPKKKGSKSIRSDQNIKLALMSTFLSQFTAIIKIGFYQKKNKENTQGRAIQYNLGRALSGESPNFEINYRKIVFSRGLREPAWSGKTERASDKQIQISWEIPETAKLKLISNDKAVVQIYNASKKKRMEALSTVVRRELFYSIAIPEIYKNDTLHIWLFFTSADGKMISNSEYMGTV